MKFTYLLVILTFSLWILNVTAKLGHKHKLRKFRAPAATTPVYNSPYTSQYLQVFATGAGLSITGEVADKDVSGCITPLMKSSNYDIEIETEKQLKSLLINLQRLHRIVTPAMNHSDLFCFKNNREHLIMRLEEVLGTTNRLNYLMRRRMRQNFMRDFGVAKGGSGGLKGKGKGKGKGKSKGKGKGKGKSKGKGKGKGKGDIDLNLYDIDRFTPLINVRTDPFWYSHFNSFFAFNLDNLRAIRNKILEFLGSDLTIEMNKFLACIAKKKNAQSRSHKSILGSTNKVKILSVNMRGFINVLVNSICNWRSYKMFVENLVNAKAEKDATKRFTLYGRAIGEFIMAVGQIQ